MEINWEDYRGKLLTPEEDSDAGSIYEELQARVTNYFGSADAKVNQLSEQTRKDAEEIARLKAANYDAMMAAPKLDNTSSTQGEDKEPEPRGINRLIGRN